MHIYYIHNIAELPPTNPANAPFKIQPERTHRDYLGTSGWHACIHHPCPCIRLVPTTFPPPPLLLLYSQVLHQGLEAILQIFF